MYKIRLKRPFKYDWVIITCSTLYNFVYSVMKSVCKGYIIPTN